MIIDTNVLVQIFLTDDASKPDILRNQLCEAPAFLKIELINVLRKIHFLNNIPLKIVEETYISAISYVYKFHDNDGLLLTARELSFQLNHPIYDCLFLALAKKTNNAFVSSDKRLLKKADNIGVETILF
jgi:predicted nucleic acid-binding protein